jgi:hypothetical protein
MSRFKTEICCVEIGGKLYRVDKALVPALQHVPVELLPPLLAVIDRDLLTRHAAWIRADKRAAVWRAKWMGQAMPLLESGLSYANIGKILEGKNLGSADRIARALAKFLAPPRAGLHDPLAGFKAAHTKAHDTAKKKKSVRRRQRT